MKCHTRLSIYSAFLRVLVLVLCLVLRASIWQLVSSPHAHALVKGVLCQPVCYAVQLFSIFRNAWTSPYITHSYSWPEMALICCMHLIMFTNYYFGDILLADGSCLNFLGSVRWFSAFVCQQCFVFATRLNSDFDHRHFLSSAVNVNVYICVCVCVC